MGTLLTTSAAIILISIAAAISCFRHRTQNEQGEDSGEVGTEFVYIFVLTYFASLLRILNPTFSLSKVH